jgi:Ni/Fe-hydrogenase subunit HybB-like protein
MGTVHYRTIEGRSVGYYGLLGLLTVFVLAGLAAAHYMDLEGHHVTGMNNQIVWGTPHVFAVFLIVAASGALNVASVASVFGRAMYKPLARLSGLLAIALLVGGLAILVLDLGRPDRLIVAMTYYNFKSIFAWNIFLYIGFLAVVVMYLWMMFERRMNQYSERMSYVAFIWRLVLTTGTGSIFGFLVARQAYDAAIMAPMFIVMSLSFGTAVFLLVLMATYRWTARTLGNAIVRRLKNLQGIFVAGTLYFVLAHHLTNLYATEHHGIERFLLMDGGVYPTIFWTIQIVLGGLVPLALFYFPMFRGSRIWIGIGAALVIVGGLGQVYVIIIGGQAYPLMMFPGMEVSSNFFDGVVGTYTPSLPEIALGVGGSAFAVLLTILALRVLPFLPRSLSDADFTTDGGPSAVADEIQSAQTSR